VSHLTSTAQLASVLELVTLRLGQMRDVEYECARVAASHSLHHVSNATATVRVDIRATTNDATHVMIDFDLMPFATAYPTGAITFQLVENQAQHGVGQTAIQQVMDRHARQTFGRLGSICSAIQALISL
jgi:hypothetical protein